MTTRSNLRTAPEHSTANPPFGRRVTALTRAWTVRQPAASFSRASANTISPALSETGKTLLPRSTLSGTPRPSKYSITARGGNAANDANINRGLPGIFSRNSSRVQSLVTLHLPLPVMPSLRPRFSSRSKRVTAAPSLAAVAAVIIPAAPPPITATVTEGCAANALPHTSVLGFVIYIIFIPDVFELFKALTYIIRLFACHRHDYRIDYRKRSNK